MRIKTKGVVLRENIKGETSKLLTFLTQDLGVITVNAKGVRKLSSPYLKSAQLFAFSDLLLHEKNGYYTLAEASLIAEFYDLSKDMNNYALACYLCDAASAFVVNGDDSGNALRLLLNSLYALENKISPREIVKSAFELRLCCECGFDPSLDFCCECGEDLNGMQCYFNVSEGEACCGDCGGNGMDVFSVTPAVNKALQHITQCELSRLLSFRLEDSESALLAKICEKFFLLRAERGFKTLSFYKHCEELP